MLDVEDRGLPPENARRHRALVMTDEENSTSRLQKSKRVPTHRKRIEEVLECLKARYETQTLRLIILDAKNVVAYEALDSRSGKRDRSGRRLDTRDAGES